MKAFKYMRDIVRSEPLGQKRIIKSMRNWNFALHTNADNLPSSFEAVFIADDIMYEYGFEITNGEISQEYLYRKDVGGKSRKAEVFKRTDPDNKNISFGKKYSKEMGGISHLTQNAERDNLFLYWAVVGGNSIAKSVFNWFSQIWIIEDRGIEKNELFHVTDWYIRKGPEEKNKILNFIRQANPIIENFDFQIRQDKFQTDAINKIFECSKFKGNIEISTLDLLTDYKVYENDSQDDWRELGTTRVSGDGFESAGTLALLKYSGIIHEILEMGGIVFIDELDASIHPILMRYIVGMFNSIDKNPNGAQLVCTIHDALLMEEDLRRDQIYFVEKDSYGRSTMYSLSDFRGVRQESSIIRKYLLGAFGATPMLSDYLPSKQEG